MFLRTPTLRSGGLKLSMIKYGKGGFTYIKLFSTSLLGGAFLNDTYQIPHPNVKEMNLKCDIC